MDPSSQPIKKGELDSLVVSSSPYLPVVTESPANDRHNREGGDETIASQLLSSKTPKGDSSDVDNTLNPISESSGSDHLSDSQVDWRPLPRPRATSESRLSKGLYLSEPIVIGPNTPASVHAVNARRDTGSVGLTTQYLQEDRGDGRKSISPSLLNSSTPQLSRPETPQIAPSSSSAPTTPSTGADSQTYSFVFTSSRQPGTIAGDSLIGIINPSSSKQFSAPKRPPVLPKQRRKSTLTPEQIRAHALGAVHAISESSPFHPGDNARPSTVAQMDLPIQTPMLSSNVDPIDRSLQRQGIDVYVNAARQGRNKASQASPTSPRPQTVRSYSHATTLESLGEETKDQIFHEPPSPTTMSEAPSRRWPKQRKIKNYARYVEDESNDASFTTTNILGRRTPSLGSSASSSHSKQSIDESLTGLSCFGVIGSGTPGGVFGSAVINTGRAQSTEQHLLLTQATSSNASTTPVSKATG